MMFQWFSWFSTISKDFLKVFNDFQCIFHDLSMIVSWFSFLFNNCSTMCPWFLIVFNDFNDLSMGFSMHCQWILNDVSMIFFDIPKILYDFSMMFHRCFNDISKGFQWLLNDYSMIFNDFRWCSIIFNNVSIAFPWFSWFPITPPTLALCISKQNIGFIKQTFVFWEKSMFYYAKQQFY